MNRVIKFRGKRVDNREWVYGDLFQSFCEDKAFINPTNCLNMDEYDFREVDKETIGQFTELLDKNGKEIYEGDIVKSINKYNGGTTIGKVYFEDFTWFGAKDYLSYVYDWCNIEIIGNIHDNPELLNDTEKTKV